MSKRIELPSFWVPLLITLLIFGFILNNPKEMTFEAVLFILLVGILILLASLIIFSIILFVFNRHVMTIIICKLADYFKSQNLALFGAGAMQEQFESFHNLDMLLFYTYEPLDGLPSAPESNEYDIWKTKVTYAIKRIHKLKKRNNGWLMLINWFFHSWDSYARKKLKKIEGVQYSIKEAPIEFSINDLWELWISDISIKTYENEKSTNVNVQKIACNKCGKMILPNTARKTGGICMPCFKGKTPIL